MIGISARAASGLMAFMITCWKIRRSSDMAGWRCWGGMALDLWSNT